jgi:hypothetical protein
MDPSRFALLTRLLTNAFSRRTTVGAGIGAALSALALTEVGAKECKKCSGTCEPMTDGTTCGKGKVCCKGKCRECCVDADCDPAANQECLSNRSCAKVCQAPFDCPDPCACGKVSTEDVQRRLGRA